MIHETSIHRRSRAVDRAPHFGLARNKKRLDISAVCRECGNWTRFGKPFCSEHIHLIEEVIELRRLIERRRAEGTLDQ